MDKKMITKRFFPIVIALMLAVALVIPVAVVSAAPALATRTLPASVDEGAYFDVGIEASGCGAFGQVVETLPSGFSYVGTDSTDVTVTPEDSTVKFTFIGDSVSFDYTVTASTTAGTYSFSGVVKDEDTIEYTISGDTDITVAPAGVLVGDANGDGSVNALDITKVERIIAGEDAQTPGADANQDGNINAVDITKIERIIAGLV